MPGSAASAPTDDTACFARLADLLGGAGHATAPNGGSCGHRTHPEQPELAGATRAGAARRSAAVLPRATGTRRTVSRPQTACHVLPAGQRSATQRVEACQPAAAGHGSDAGAPRWRVRRRAGARTSRSGRAGRPESPARCRAGACRPPWPTPWRQAALAAGGPSASPRLSSGVARARAQVQRAGSCGYATCHPTRQQLPDTVGMRLTASNPPAGALAPSETAPAGQISPLVDTNCPS